MRTEQERMELIRKRTLEIRKKEKKRRQRIIDMGCAAASIFGTNSAQGYIVMGIICFFIGVCVTVLLYRLHRKAERDHFDEF